MTDEELMTLRDAAAHAVHVVQAALTRAVQRLTALDAAVTSRLNGSGATVQPLDGDPKPGG